MTNKEIIAAAFDAMAAGNTRPWVEAMAEDIRYEFVGGGAWARVYEGRKAFREGLGAESLARFQLPLTMFARRILEAEDGHVIVEAENRNTLKSGEPYDNRYLFVMRLSGGRIVDLVEFCDTHYAMQKLGNPSWHKN